MIQSKMIEQNIRMLLAKRAGDTTSGKADLKKKMPANIEISLYWVNKLNLPRIYKIKSECIS